MAFNPINWFLGLFSLDIGIDLGTANTLVHVRNKGIVINEPSFVVIDKRTHAPFRVGAEAKAMVGRVPGKYMTVRPLQDGVISEFEITAEMLDHFISRAHQQSMVPLPRPRVVIGVPSGVTEVEKRAVYNAAVLAGAREVYLIPEPTASAIAVGLPVFEIGGSMIVDIGGGTTEITVFSGGGVVTSRSLRVAGDELDQDIYLYMRDKYNLHIGDRTAEQIKITLGSAFPLSEEKTMDVRGKNLITGLPETIEVSSIEIRDAISGSVDVILQTIKDVLDEVQPEIISDLMDIGICLAGGGSLLGGLADRVEHDVRIKAWVAEDPMTCVARGAGKALENLSKYAGLMMPLEN